MTANAASQEAVSLSSGGALFTRFATVDTAVGNNTTTISNHTTSIATLDSASVSQANSISTNVDDIIATARDTATAGTGSCSAGGHDNRISCEAAGQVWTQQTFATSTNAVQISDGHGNTTTVGNHLSTSRDFEGNMEGRYTMGVTTAGVFTGVTAIASDGGNGNAESKLIFQGDKIAFQKTNGTNSLYYDGSQWVFNGNLSAASGTFSGTVEAEKIIGDLVDIGKVSTAGVEWDGGTNSDLIKTLTKVRIPAVSYKRYVTFSGVTVLHDATVTGDKRVEYYVRNYTDATGSTTASGSAGHVLVEAPVTGGRNIITMPTLVVVLNANLEGYFEITIKAYDRADNGVNTKVNGQNIAVTHGRAGDTITQY